MVLVGHLMSWLGIFPFVQPPYVPYLQGIGVVLFFILSGFVIPYSTSVKFNSKGSYTFKEYFIDRFARIYSSYLPCLLMIFLLDISLIQFTEETYNYHDGFDLKTFFANIFMLQDFPLNGYLSFFDLTSFGSGRPLWTLAVEWWIYFWFGFTYLVIIKQKRTNLITLGVFLLFSIVPYFNFIAGRGDGLMLPWLLGCLVLILLPVVQGFNLNKYFIFLLLILLSIMIYKRYLNTEFKYVEFYYVCLLAVVVLLLIVLFSKINFGLRAKKLINFLADYSFTLYLLHYTVLNILISLFAKSVNPYLLFAAGLILPNLLSMAVAYFTEMRYRTFRIFLKAKFLKSNK